MVALLLTLEGGGTSLCSPSREEVSWLGVRLHTDTLPSCTDRRPFAHTHTWNSLLGIPSTPAISELRHTATLPSGNNRRACRTGFTAVCVTCASHRPARFMLPYQCLAMLQQEKAWQNAPQLIFVSDMCQAPCYELHLMCSSQAPGRLY